VILGDSVYRELRIRINLLVERQKIKKVKTNARVLLLRGREALDLREVVVVALEDGNVPFKLRDVLLLHTEHSCALVCIT
jgi:hypothetical protein